MASSFTGRWKTVLTVAALAILAGTGVMMAQEPFVEAPVTQPGAIGRAVLADEWFDLLEAPAKERIVFEDSGHRPSFEEPGRYAELMRRVRDETYVDA